MYIIGFNFMEAIAIHDTRYDVVTSSFSGVEIADDQKRAILLLPLMHVGANKKGLYWTAKMLKKIAPLFKSVPYRYDLDGQEGSSHTINKLSSPHFDVGWTYSSDDGAWYDDMTKILWTKGEVTHPDVIAKLSRITTDGKREVNYGSMGVIVEKAVCSICGADMNGNTCEEGHNRLEKYDGKTCYKVPTEVSKALHVALTNDPADGEAEIKNVLIQELGGNMQEDNFQKKGNKDATKDPDKDNDDDTSKSGDTDKDYEAAPQDKKGQAGQQADKSQLNSQIPGGLAPSSPQTAQPGMAPSPETMLKDLAERIKTIEQKISLQAMSNPQPEVVNASPQDQFMQSNMGNTSQFEGQKQAEASNMDVKDGQTSNAKTSLNPEKSEMQDVMGGDPMSQIMGMLQQILQRLPGAEVQDMGKEALSANKGQAKKSQDDLPTEHLGEGAVGGSEDEGNAKNKANMMKPGMVATADNQVESEENIVVLKSELADMKAQMKQMRAKLEIQDSGIVPEFGGSTKSAPSMTEIADMGAEGRKAKFGEYGAWDSIFNGPISAERFKR